MAAVRVVNDVIIYSLFRIAAATFAVLPEPWVRWIGINAGRVGYSRGGSKLPLLRSHMRRVMGPSVPDAQVELAVAEMYRSYGRYWAETFWFRPPRTKGIIDGVERVNFDDVYASVAAGNARIFAMPHIGNWEVAGAMAKAIDSPALAVAEQLSNERITDWFIDVRERFGIDVILTSNPNLTRSLIRRLKSGGSIALVSDRDVTGKGVDVEFFGEITTMPAGPIVLAEMTGADLFPVAAYFKEGAGHRIVVHDQIVLADLPTREERISDGMQQLARALEDFIREEPGQWHLFQPNWPSDAALNNGGGE